MPRVGGDVQIRTALEFHQFRLALEFDGGPPFQNDDPFVAFLIVPEIVRRPLAIGDDPFDPDALVAAEDGDQFFGKLRRDAAERGFRRSWRCHASILYDVIPPEMLRTLKPCCSKSRTAW